MEHLGVLFGTSLGHLEVVLDTFKGHLGDFCRNLWDILGIYLGHNMWDIFLGISRGILGTHQGFLY